MSGIISKAAPRWVSIVRSPSGETSDMHLPERPSPRNMCGSMSRLRSARSKKSPVVSRPTSPIKPVRYPIDASARMVLSAEPPSESE